MWKPWVTGTGNYRKPLNWKQPNGGTPDKQDCPQGLSALCRSMYAGGWAAGVLFTRFQWSLSIWKSASLSWAGQTDLWKVTHILEGITSATHTPLSSTPSTVLQIFTPCSLHSSSQQHKTKQKDGDQQGKGFSPQAGKFLTSNFVQIVQKLTGWKS